MKFMAPFATAILAWVFASPAAGQEALDGVQRHENARVLLEQALRIGDILPNLPPETGRRIADERDTAIASRNLTRFRELAETKDYTIWNVAQHMDPLREALTSLANGRFGSRQAEVEQWARVAKLLSESSFYMGLEKMGQMGLVSAPILIDGEAPSVRFQEFRLNIHNNILMPYMEGRLPD